MITRYTDVDPADCDEFLLVRFEKAIYLHCTYMDMVDSFNQRGISHFYGNLAH
jgi:hypothetical protein